jgi:hypothetical protein
MTLKEVVQDVVSEPMSWHFYPVYFGVVILVNMFEYGCTRSALLGGLINGIVALGALCLARRLLVRHWR